MSPHSQIPRYIAVLAVILIGIAIFLPELFFQSGIAQGDHGRDLYAFQSVLEDERPYHDFWWPYGPLMPYYYAFFFKIFGSNFQAVMLGRMICIVTSGAFFFLALSCFCATPAAFVGTLWFYIYFPKFTHTYNHFGAIALLPLIVFCVFTYLREHRSGYLFLGLAGIFFLSLIKINIGLATFLAFLISVFLIDHIQKVPIDRKKIKFYLWTLSVPLGVGVIYFLCLKGLPGYYLRQCFPYFNADLPYHQITFFSSLLKLFRFLKTDMTSRLFFYVMTTLAFIAAAHLFYRVRKRELNNTESKEVLLVAIILGLCSIVNMHEFFRSSVYYRLFWSRPFTYLLMFYLLAKCLRTLSVKTRYLVLIAIVAHLSWVHLGRCTWKVVFKTYSTNQFFPSSQGKFYAQNKTDWFQTVHDTTRFLRTHLKKDETFAAIPYDPLYFFLAKKRSPIRNVVLFEYMNISDNQQQEMIAQLKRKKVPLVLISNRAFSSELGMGIFGKTYCQKLDQYIKDHYTLVAQLGQWHKPPGYMWNHGTRIYRRTK